MNKKDLIVKLEEVYGNMEQLEDEMLSDVIRFNNKTKDKLGEVIQFIEDEMIAEDKEDE